VSGIRVVITDLDTGETETAEIMDDYLLITAGSAYRSGYTVYGNGTHVVTVKGVHPRKGGEPS
jgi:hypothetical protein